MTRLALLLATLLASPVWAEEPSPERLDQQLRSMVEADSERALADMTQLLFRLAPDGVLTAAEAEALRRTDLAQRRASLLLTWLGFDLDGDFAIGADEVAVLRAGLEGERRAELETLLALADTDGDGGVGRDEIEAHAEAVLEERGAGGLTEIDRLLALDGDGDGGLSLEELRRGIAAMAAGEPVGSAGAAAPERLAACDLPTPSPGAQVVYLAASHGGAFSTLALTGQGGHTRAARVIVEPGEAPLYVVAVSTFATVWRFEGDLDRVERIVAGGLRDRAAGVVGLAPDRVSLQDMARCLPDWINDPWGREAGIAAGQIARALGRERADHQVTGLTLDRVSVTSGAVAEGEEPPDLLDRLVAQAVRPNGYPLAAELHPVADEALVEVAPDEVVGTAPAEPYEVLPGDAGLLQLLLAGVLEPIGYRRFHVVKPLERFPPGLLNVMGGFVLAPGIPLPEGNPGSWVFSEDTGQCLTEHGCGIGAGSDVMMWTWPTNELGGQDE